MKYFVHFWNALWPPLYVYKRKTEKIAEVINVT